MPKPQSEAKAGPFDLDLGEAGLIEQKCELADERGILAGKLYGCFVVWLARHVLIRMFCVKRERQALGLMPSLAARPWMARR